MKILFVENHEVFASIVEREFLSEYEVIRRKTVGESWSEIEKNYFDICLVDYDLDDGKGDELISKIRKSGVSVKIIAISSHNEGNSKLMNAGADKTCSKMQFKQIKEVIKSLMQN